MEWIREHLLRKSRKLTDCIPIAMVETFLVTVLGGVIAALVLYRVLNLPEPSGEGGSGYLDMLMMYGQTWGVWVAVAIAIALPPANRRMFRDIVPNGRGNSLAGIVIGLLLGFSANAVCILISSVKGDISLSLGAFEPVRLLALFGTVFIQSGSEEILCRQFLYEKLRRRYKSPAVAIVANSLFFVALHLFNPGITAVSCAQIGVVGLLFSLFVYYFDGLWIAILFHTTWNFTQNIIFGCPNSGILTSYSLFELQSASAGPFFDPAFGVEGSVGAVGILAALIVAVIVYAKAKREETQDLWADLDEGGSGMLPSGSGSSHSGGASSGGNSSGKSGKTGKHFA